MAVELTNPELWEACKQEAIGKIGPFNNRAMQEAIRLYKEAGGGYVPKPEPKPGEIDASNIGTGRISTRKMA